jgi:hypothetical protein
VQSLWTGCESLGGSVLSVGGKCPKQHRACSSVVEHLPFKQRVGGSIPPRLTKANSFCHPCLWSFPDLTQTVSRSDGSCQRSSFSSPSVSVKAGALECSLLSSLREGRMPCEIAREHRLSESAPHQNQPNSSTTGFHLHLLSGSLDALLSL